MQLDKKKIRLTARSLGLQDKDLAEHLCITQAMFSRRLTGEIEWRGAEVKLLADILEVDVATLQVKP